jgi:hypothetical protein
MVMIRYIGLILFVAVWVSPKGFCQDEVPRFDHYVLKSEFHFKELIDQDLNGDGLVDLVVTGVSGFYPDYDRSLFIFFQGTDGSFGESADQSIPIDGGAAVVDTGDVLGAPGAELLLMDSKGVRAASLEGDRYGAFQRIITADCFTAVSDPFQIPVLDFARDWDGDKDDEILVQGFQTAGLYQGTEAGPREIRLGVKARVSPTYLPGFVIESKYLLPEYVSLDFNGDGIIDLVAYYDDNILAFFQRDGGKFPESPDARIPLSLWDEKTRRQRERRPIAFGIAPDFYLMGDELNAKPGADFIALTLTGGIIGLTSKLCVYFGDHPGFKSGQPAQIITIKNAGAGPYLADLDGDGIKELFVNYMSMSVGAAAKTVLSGKAEVISECYKLGPSGRYPDRPTFAYHSAVKADFKTITIEGTLPVLEGDFNGDGLMDFLQGMSKEEMVVILQNQDRFDHDPDLRLRVPSPLQLMKNPRICDFNKDGLDDFAVVYPIVEDHAQEVHVLINRGGW